MISTQQETFNQKYVVEPHTIITLPESMLIAIKNYYIYPPYILVILSYEYEEAKKQYQILLSNEIEKFLLKSPNPGVPFFFKDREINNSIRQFLVTHYPLFHAISEYPNVIWHSLRNVKKNKQNLTKSKSDALLLIFFNMSTKELNEWYNIMEIDIIKIYTQTFRSLGILKKLIVLFKKTNQKFFQVLNSMYKTENKNR